MTIVKFKVEKDPTQEAYHTVLEMADGTERFVKQFRTKEIANAWTKMEAANYNGNMSRNHGIEPAKFVEAS